jgi:hypothetical protein
MLLIVILRLSCFLLQIYFYRRLEQGCPGLRKNTRFLGKKTGFPGEKNRLFMPAAAAMPDNLEG